MPIVTPVPAGMPTVDDLKAQLNDPSDDTVDEDELGDYLAASIGVVEGMVGPLTARPIVGETHYGVTSTLIALRECPVASLTALTVRLYSSWYSVDPAMVELDSATGVIRYANGAWFRGDVRVDYSAGASTVAPTVRLATLIIAAHLWETQRGAQNPTPVQAASGDYVAMGPAGFAVPNRAAELLANHLKGPRVA